MRESEEIATNEGRVCRDGPCWRTCSHRVHVRIVFTAKVQSAAVAGLTAYVWPERESGIVDRCTCQLLRKLTRVVAVEQATKMR